MQRGENRMDVVGREARDAKGWMHLRVTRALSRRIPFSGSFPTRGRDGTVLGPGIRGISYPRKLYRIAGT